MQQKRNINKYFFGVKMKTIRRPCDRPGSGFTLIELLVVIAIIALLLSILMPSLSKAKHHAREVICKAHLHGLGQYYWMYAADNDDLKIPGSYYWFWHYAWVEPAYYDLNGNGLVDADDGIVGLGHLVEGGYIDKPNEDNSSNVFICPGARAYGESRRLWGISGGTGYSSFSNWKQPDTTVTVMYEMRPEVNPYIPSAKIRKHKLTGYSSDIALLSDMLAWGMSEGIHDKKINLLKVDGSIGVYNDRPKVTLTGSSFFLYELFSEDKAGFYSYYFWNAFTKEFKEPGTFFVE